MEKQAIEVTPGISAKYGQPKADFDFDAVVKGILSAPAVEFPVVLEMQRRSKRKNSEGIAER